MIPALTDRQRYWLEHVQACEASGKSIAEYAVAQEFGAQAVYLHVQLAQFHKVFAFKSDPVCNGAYLELDGPLLVTQNGKARFVVQNAEDYEYQQETLALLKLLILSDKSLEKETLSLDQAFGT